MILHEDWGDILKILIFYNPYRVSYDYLSTEVRSVFEKYENEIINIISAGSGIIDNSAQEADCYVVFGGDGTVLRVAEISAINSKPIVGINMGNLGFLSSYSQDEIENAAQDLSKGEISFSERHLIECFVGGKKFVSLNDIVLQKSQPLGTIDLEVIVGKSILYSFLGDGVIVSTPTGSTGYSMSAGGPIIDPSINVTEIVPLAPHTLNIRPFIISPDKYIELKVNSIDTGFAYVTGDGDIIHRLEAGMSLVITGSDKKVKLSQKKGDNYFDLLNYKLGFGRRFE